MFDVKFNVLFQNLIIVQSTSVYLRKAYLFSMSYLVSFGMHKQMCDLEYYNLKNRKV